MVMAPPPKASNSAARRLASSESATHGYGFGGCHCRLGRRRLGSLSHKLGVFAGKGRLEVFFIE
jgi:hypothetical protein